MTQIDHIRRTLDYDLWATNRTIESLRAVEPPPDNAVRWCAHIIGAGSLWLSRVRGEPSPLPVWPELRLEEFEGEFSRITDGWRDTVAGLHDGDLANSIAYVNSQGNAYTNTLLEIITHLTHHGAYHRGQIASALRAAGAEPAMTDFIVFVR